MANNLTNEQAFEIAKAEIKRLWEVANKFYTVSAEFKDGDWRLIVGWVDYYNSEFINSDRNQKLDLDYINNNIDTPFIYHQTQVVVGVNGEVKTTTDDFLDISEHPNYQGGDAVGELVRSLDQSRIARKMLFQRLTFKSTLYHLLTPLGVSTTFPLSLNHW